MTGTSEVIRLAPFTLALVALLLLPLLAYRAQRREEAEEHATHGADRGRPTAPGTRNG